MILGAIIASPNGLTGDRGLTVALLAAGATLTVLFVTQRTAGDHVIRVKDHFAMAAVFGVAAALLLAVALVNGSSILGLIVGLLLTPLKMASVALLPLPLPGAGTRPDRVMTALSRA